MVDSNNDLTQVWEIYDKTNGSSSLPWNAHFGTHCTVIDEKILRESRIQGLVTYYTLKSNLTCLYTSLAGLLIGIPNLPSPK